MMKQEDLSVNGEGLPFNAIIFSVMAGMAIDRKKSLKPYGIRDSCTSWSIQFMKIAFYSVKKRHGKTAILVQIERGRG